MAELRGTRGADHASGVLGYLNGEPVGRQALDRRLDAMRRGPRAAMLPAPGSAEDRQLARWLTQVILTEALCEAEAAARKLPLDPRRYARLDHQAAVEYGSINAAAFQGSPAARAVARDVT